MNKKSRSKVIVIVAPSGAGKTTICHLLLKEFPLIKFSISATTRAPRNGEIDGKDYYFLSDGDFVQRVNEKRFLEWEFYSGNKYGTLQSEVDKLLKSGYFPLLDIEVKGALNVKRIYEENCISIFIQPPSMNALKKRLIKRGTETSISVQNRLKRAEEEINFAKNFDYLVVNDDLETAYKEVKAIIEPFITD